VSCRPRLREGKKSGKSVIFQITRGSDDQFLQATSNPISTRDAAFDFASIAVGQFLQTFSPTDLNDHQMSTDLIQAPPLQGAGSRSIVVSDPDFATSKKFPTDEDVEKHNFEKLTIKILLAA
jgi:hypothetical protein